MNYNLTDKVALITGGSKGIGAAIVRELAAEGAKVYFCARASKQFFELQEEMNAKGFNVEGIIADVESLPDIQSVFTKISHENSHLDILINNVGGAKKYGSFLELDDKDWIDALEFNILPVVRFVRLAMPLLRLSLLKRIINISSITATQPGFYNPHYSAAKAGIVNLSKHLSKIFADEKILVNVVCPGPVHSEAWNSNVENMTKINNQNFEEAWNILEMQEAKKIPLGRVGEPEDISGLVAFLTSPAANWITGSVFHINGGKLNVAI